VLKTAAVETQSVFFCDSKNYERALDQDKRFFLDVCTMLL